MILRHQNFVLVVLVAAAAVLTVFLVGGRGAAKSCGRVRAPLGNRLEIVTVQSAPRRAPAGARNVFWGRDPGVAAASGLTPG